MRQLIAIILAIVLVIATLTLVSCGKKENKKKETSNKEIAPEILEALSEVPDVTPKKVIATQVVAGLNYAVLCDSEDGEAVCVVYKNLQNEYKYIKTMPASEFIIPETDELLCGGWVRVNG